jgi:hypothetical protein
LAMFVERWRRKKGPRLRFAPLAMTKSTKPLAQGLHTVLPFVGETGRG